MAPPAPDEHAPPQAHPLPYPATSPPGLHSPRASPHWVTDDVAASDAVGFHALQPTPRGIPDDELTGQTRLNGTRPTPLIVPQHLDVAEAAVDRADLVPGGVSANHCIAQSALDGHDGSAFLVADDILFMQVVGQ